MKQAHWSFQPGLQLFARPGALWTVPGVLEGPHGAIPPAPPAVSLEAGDGEFQALLDIWFPEKKPLPTAFLVDTSEEALLLPDWLKLRMIRSEVPRLVDAGTAGQGWGGEGPPAGPGYAFYPCSHVCWTPEDTLPRTLPARCQPAVQKGDDAVVYEFGREGKGWGPQSWSWKDSLLGSTRAGQAA